MNNRDLGDFLIQGTKEDHYLINNTNFCIFVYSWKLENYVIE